MSGAVMYQLESSQEECFERVSVVTISMGLGAGTVGVSAGGGRDGC